MNEKTNALINLMQDAVIGAKLINAASIEDAIAIFAENGIEVSESELQEILVPVNDLLSADELDEAALENVAGGVNWWKVGKFVCTVIGALCDLLK